MALRGSIVSLEPLVVMSSIREPYYAGIAQVFPALFANTPSLHLLSPSWSILDNMAALRNTLVEARKALPRAQFVVVANEEAEELELKLAGIPSIPGTATMFIDETVFDVLPGTDQRFEALYNATLRPFKNHQLCQDIGNLALIYYLWATDTQSLQYVDTIRQSLAHATWLNDAPDGSYRRLSAREVARANNESAVGLCLSHKEGAMRAAMEFLLCGTPIVSVPSIGGRQRYFTPLNSVIAEADPVRVAAAVREFALRNTARQDIRNETLSVLRFERKSFLTSANYLVRKLTGKADAFADFSAFNAVMTYRTWEAWVEYFAAKLNHPVPRPQT
ncbi:MAG: hypothetical protein U1E15_14095 [Hyphomicrobiales bacterium]